MYSALDRRSFFPNILQMAFNLDRENIHSTFVDEAKYRDFSLTDVICEIERYHDYLDIEVSQAPYRCRITAPNKTKSMLTLLKNIPWCPSQTIEGNTLVLEGIANE